jgi:hypothetical protein
MSVRIYTVSEGQIAQPRDFIVDQVVTQTHRKANLLFTDKEENGRYDRFFPVEGKYILDILAKLCL